MTQVSILGAGTMGHGIAQVAAMADHEVTMCDIEAAYVDDGLDAIESNPRGGIDRDKVMPDEMAAALDRLPGTISLEAAVTDVDLAVGAVSEDMGLKCEMIAEVESLVDDDAAIAPDTSSFSVTQILSALERPERGLGLHFFNPIHVMELVEVVVAEQTSGSTLALAVEFVEGINKTAVEVGDSPDFASSRLGVVPGVETVRMVQEGIASSTDVDTAMELGYNHPMRPLELGDAVGLDVRLDILEYLREELGERFRPSQTLKRKVCTGKLGKKIGEGFYVWKDGEIVGTPEDVMDR